MFLRSSIKKNTCMLSLLDEAILMSTHNIHFHDKMIEFLSNIPQYLFSCHELSEKFPRDSDELK